MNQLELWGIYFFGLFRNCRRRQQPWDGPRGFRSSLLWRALQRVPVRVPGFDSFSCRLDEITGFAKTEYMYKRGAGMLARDPLVTQIRYGGEHQC